MQLFTVVGVFGFIFCFKKCIEICFIKQFWTILLILDGNPDYVAHAWRKIGLCAKKSYLWLLIQKNISTRIGTICDFFFFISNLLFSLVFFHVSPNTFFSFAYFLLFWTLIRIPNKNISMDMYQNKYFCFKESYYVFYSKDFLKFF